MSRLLWIALAGTAVLAGPFLSVLLREDATLRNSLVDMSILRPVSRRDVLVSSGTVLQGDLATRTLTAAESPYLLRGPVRIPYGSAVRVDRGVRVAAEEGASLTVEGTLAADGAAFFSTHLHPTKRLWHGIVAQNGGSVALTQTALSNATAALTCGPGGSVTVRDGRARENAAGMVTLQGSRVCTVTNTRVADGRVGFQLVGGAPTIRTVTLDRILEGIRVYHDARPILEDITVRRLGRAVVRYAASPTLVIRGLTVRDTRDLTTLILDGRTTPTHLWQGSEVPTGRVELH